jgi:hypothetical protein
MMTENVNRSFLTASPQASADQGRIFTRGTRRPFIGFHRTLTSIDGPTRISLSS